MFSKSIVRHIAYFRTTTHRGLENFQLMLQSEDMGLDGVLRTHIHTSRKLDLAETNQIDVNLSNRIIIYDCRRTLPEMTEVAFRENLSNGNIALIDPDRGKRNDAFTNGFADYLVWPVLAPELYTRLLAQCRSLSLDDPQFRYSRVSLVERCCAYLTENIAEPTTVQSLATMFNTNHNTLNATFNKELGLPPLAWQRKMRLEGAARLLRLTNHPIHSIAERFGYDLPGNFSTAFRKHFGVSPQSYRKNENPKTSHDS